MPLYDCGDPDCLGCQIAFGPDRSAAIARHNAREGAMERIGNGPCDCCGRPMVNNWCQPCATAEKEGRKFAERTNLASRTDTVSLSVYESAVQGRRDFRAAFYKVREALIEARRRLEKGRPFWNGPCHECAAVLDAAIGNPIVIGPDSADQNASLYSGEWKHATVSGHD